LFNEKIIAASRDFVCIRLATYEDEAEADFLRTIYVNRSGELDNTVFVLLSPDTKRDLSRAGRGPQFEFHSPSRLATEMKEIASQFPTKKRQSDSVPILPQLKNIRLGINVSSCDGLPAVICYGENESQINGMKNKLSPLAFADSLAGKFVYASTSDKSELATVAKFKGETGFLIVKPGDYGVDGELVKVIDANADADELQSALVNYANGTGRVDKNHRSHVRDGLEKGMNWETAIPVTDPGSIGAMKRNEAKRNRNKDASKTKASQGDN